MASRLSPFLAELKRRNVYRVAVVYVVMGVGILGAAEVILDPLGLNALRADVVIFVLLGFPLALVLAWAHEVKPEEPPSPGAAQQEATPSPPIIPSSGPKLPDRRISHGGGGELHQITSRPSGAERPTSHPNKRGRRRS